MVIRLSDRKELNHKIINAMKRRFFITALAILAITASKAQDTASETIDRMNSDLSKSDVYLFEMYQSRFIEYPTLRIALQPGSLAIDPSRVIPFGDQGYLYPARKLKGDWGKLSSNEFIMFSKDWKYMMLTIPREIDGKLVRGDDWTLAIKGSSYILRNQEDKNFYLIR